MIGVVCFFNSCGSNHECTGIVLALRRRLAKLPIPGIPLILCGIFPRGFPTLGEKLVKGGQPVRRFDMCSHTVFPDSDGPRGQRQKEGAVLKICIFYSLDSGNVFIDISP